MPDNGPTPTSPPPGSPVLVITMQKQSTTAVLPVNGGANGYGTAPYLGLSMSLFEGYGAPSSDPFNLPGITGSFGSTVSALQIFSNGQAGGSTSFSSNDNVGNTTGVTENDCDTNLVQESNFADGTTNNQAFIVHPSATCGDAAAAASFTIDTVQFGSTDTNDYAIVSGLADHADTNDELIPSGDIATAIGLASTPAGKVAIAISPTSETDTGPYPQTKTAMLKITNTSPAGCDISVAKVFASGTNSLCTVTLASTSTVSEGDTVNTLVGVNCTCTGKTPAESDIWNINSTSSNCPIASGASVPFTCKN